jgi:NAD(P)-dependent dehydrogenase (short-subunit alcohol dehydrogenase family)
MRCLQQARPLKKLENKSALITGSGAGLGLAIAKLFAAEGAHVILSDKDQASAEAGAKAIRDGGGSACAIPCDVTLESDVQNLARETAENCAGLDILVNNAGHLLRMDFRHMQDSDWAAVLDTHLWGTIRTTRALLPLLQAAGAASGAAIVNLSSIMATQHWRQLSGYSTAKAAIIGLSRSLAVEFASYGIRVNYLCPGFIPTALTSRYTRPDFAHKLIPQIPMRRFGTVEEVAKAALFLSCDDSAYITGEGIMVDGGMSLNLA